MRYVIQKSLNKARRQYVFFKHACVVCIYIYIYNYISYRLSVFCLLLFMYQVYRIDNFRSKFQLCVASIIYYILLFIFNQKYYESF